MIEVLLKYGYVFIGMCNCEGAKTHKYRSGDYEVRWRQYKFKVKKYGNTITGWNPVADAEIILDEIHKKNIPEKAQALYHG